MKNWMIKQVVGLQFPKIIRHGLAMLGTWMAAQGVEGVDMDNLIQVATGILTIGFSAAWSFATKAPASAGVQQVITAIVGAIARQLQTSLGTFLLIDPNSLSNGQVSTVAAIMVAVNMLISRIDASDAKPKK